jgi:hypothetical protein
MWLEQVWRLRRPNTNAVHGTLPQVTVAAGGGIQQDRHQLQQQTSRAMSAAPRHGMFSR